MPIYEQTYREYDGQLRHRWRWGIIIQQELRVLIKSKFFLIMTLFALLHVIARLAQVTIYDIVAQDPNSPLALFFDQFADLAVNNLLFLDFIQFQTPVVFLVILFAGSGMICNDFNNNLVEVYFAKPITWIDYTLGKFGTLVFIGMMLTAVPGVILVGLHNMFVPGLDTIKESWWWVLAIIGFSFAVVLPTVAAVLASSALIKSKNFAAVAIFMLLMANGAMGLTLAGVLKNNNYLVWAFPSTLHRLGQAMFQDVRLVFHTHWGWSLLLVLLVSVVSCAIVCVKIRRAEVA
jgi:ABC-type transport system involved in multi-copper enzyme maturation permease subunit